MNGDSSAALVALVEGERQKIVATLARTTRDVDIAEDAFSDALLAAAQSWPQQGIPRDPAAWVFVAARRRAIDRLRLRSRHEVLGTSVEQIERQFHEQVAAPGQGADTSSPTIPDERLELIFACCHPAIAIESQVALTLRLFGGLSTPEIASAFRVPEATVAQRIARAKAKLRSAGIPYELPDSDALSGRLDAVMRVIYLIFNEGYAATHSRDVVRTDLCDEAIRLGRLLAVLMPQPKVLALASLMLFHDSRRSTRVNDAGVPVALDEQDRSRWNRSAITEAQGLLDKAIDLQGGAVGSEPYVIQACVASLHAHAVSAQETDWPQISALYSLLHAIEPSEVVTRSLIVAVAMAEGPRVGLQALAGAIDHGELAHDGPGVALLRAELLRRDGQSSPAGDQYRLALQQVASGSADALFINARLAGI